MSSDAPTPSRDTRDTASSRDTGSRDDAASRDQSEDWFWFLNSMLLEHVIPMKGKVREKTKSRAWDRQTCRNYEAGMFNDLPDGVRDSLKASAEEVKNWLYRAFIDGDKAALKLAIQVIDFKPSYTLAAYAVIAYSVLRPALGRRPNWDELKTQVQAMLKAAGESPNINEDTWRKQVQKKLGPLE